MAKRSNEFDANLKLAGTPTGPRREPQQPQQRHGDRVSKAARYVVIGLVMLGLFMLVGYLDKQTANVEMARYCRMVHQFQQTEGALGWPDYTGAYAQQCTPDGRLRPGCTAVGRPSRPSRRPVAGRIRRGPVG